MRPLTMKWMINGMQWRFSERFLCTIWCVPFKWKWTWSGRGNLKRPSLKIICITFDSLEMHWTVTGVQWRLPRYLADGYSEILLESRHVTEAWRARGFIQVPRPSQYGTTVTNCNYRYITDIKQLKTTTLTHDTRFRNFPFIWLVRACKNYPRNDDDCKYGGKTRVEHIWNADSFVFFFYWKIHFVIVRWPSLHAACTNRFEQKDKQNSKLCRSQKNTRIKS